MNLQPTNIYALTLQLESSVPASTACSMFLALKSSAVADYRTSGTRTQTTMYALILRIKLCVLQIHSPKISCSNLCAVANCSISGARTQGLIDALILYFALCVPHIHDPKFQCSNSCAVANCSTSEARTLGSISWTSSRRTS